MPLKRCATSTAIATVPLYVRHTSEMQNMLKLWCVVFLRLGGIMSDMDGLAAKAEFTASLIQTD